MRLVFAVMFLIMLSFDLKFHLNFQSYWKQPTICRLSKKSHITWNLFLNISFKFQITYTYGSHLRSSNRQNFQKWNVIFQNWKLSFEFKIKRRIKSKFARTGVRLNFLVSFTFFLHFQFLIRSESFHPKLQLESQVERSLHRKLQAKHTCRSEPPCNHRTGSVRNIKICI